MLVDTDEHAVIAVLEGTHEIVVVSPIPIGVVRLESELAKDEIGVDVCRGLEAVRDALDGVDSLPRIHVTSLAAGGAASFVAQR